MNGTLVSIDNNTAIIDFINQSTAKQERQEKPIGGTVRPHVGFLLENRIGKEVEFSVKIGLDGKEYWSFIGVPKGTPKDSKSGQDIKKEDQKMVVGLLWSADDANYKVQDANGKDHIYCVGPNNKHIMNKAVEFGTFPLTLRYSVTKDAFLSPQSQILGVPTPAEIAALTPEKQPDETKVDKTSTNAPQRHVCEVCGKDITEAEKSRSRLFYSKELCSDCLKEEEIKHKGMAPPQKSTRPAEPAPDGEDDERPGGELISPPAPEDTKAAQPLTNQVVIGDAPIDTPLQADVNICPVSQEIEIKNTNCPRCGEAIKGIFPSTASGALLCEVCYKEEIAARQGHEVNTPARPTPPPASRISIHVVINLGSYESLKIGVDGDACDRDRLRALLDDELQQYGRTNELAKTAIDSYRKRILGGAV